MLNKKQYSDAINEIVKICSYPIMEDYIFTVYLSGSVARGDYLPGRSDIDIYLVTNTKNIDNENIIKAEAHRISNEILPGLNDICGIAITCEFTTIDDVVAGSSWLGYGSEYFSFIKSAKVLFGKDSRELIKKPVEKEIKKTLIKNITSLCELVEVQELPAKEYINNYLISGVFSGIFSAAHYLLCYKEIYCRGKRDITKEFLKIIEIENIFCCSLSNFYDLWEIYGIRNLTDEEAEKLFDQGKKFILQIGRILYNK